MGAGILVSGLTAYGFLVLAARALGPHDYASLSVLWVLVFLAAPGFFWPIEQEVGRTLSARRVLGIGGGWVVVRAAVAGGALLAGIVAVAFAASGPLVSRLFDGHGLLLAGFVVAMCAYLAYFLTRGALAGQGAFPRYGELMATEGLTRVAACALLAAARVRSPGLYGLAVGLPCLAGIAVGLRRQRSFRPTGPHAEWSELSQNLGFLLGASVLGQMLVNIGPLAVKALSGPGEQAVAGTFVNGLVLARIPLFFFQAVQAALLPKLARLAAARQLADFRHTLRQLLAAVTVIGALTTVVMFAIGPAVVRLVFGRGFDLGHRDMCLLAAASALYMVGLTFAQALIALEGHALTALSWLIGIVIFAAVTAATPGLLLRVELGLVVGSGVAAAVMGGLLARRLARPASGLSPVPV